MNRFESVKWRLSHVLNNDKMPGVCREYYKSTAVVVKLQLFSVYRVFPLAFSHHALQHIKAIKQWLLACSASFPLDYRRMW